MKRWWYEAQKMELALPATLGHNSEHSLATGPVIALPLSSPLGFAMTAALSSQQRKSPSFLRQALRCRMMMACMTFFRSFWEPFFTEMMIMSPREPAGSLLSLPLSPWTAMVQTLLAPLLSAQLRTAPTGRPRVTLSLTPTLPPFLAAFDIISTTWPPLIIDHLCRNRLTSLRIGYFTLNFLCSDRHDCITPAKCCRKGPTCSGSFCSRKQTAPSTTRFSLTSPTRGRLLASCSMKAAQGSGGKAATTILQIEERALSLAAGEMECQNTFLRMRRIEFRQGARSTGWAAYICPRQQDRFLMKDCSVDRASYILRRTGSRVEQLAFTIQGQCLKHSAKHPTIWMLSFTSFSRSVYFSICGSRAMKPGTNPTLNTLASRAIRSVRLSNTGMSVSASSSSSLSPTSTPSQRVCSLPSHSLIWLTNKSRWRSRKAGPSCFSNSSRQSMMWAITSLLASFSTSSLILKRQCLFKNYSASWSNRAATGSPRTTGGSRPPCFCFTTLTPRHLQQVMTSSFRSQKKWCSFSYSIWRTRGMKGAKRRGQDLASSPRQWTAALRSLKQLVLTLYSWLESSESVSRLSQLPSGLTSSMPSLLYADSRASSMIRSKSSPNSSSMAKARLQKNEKQASFMSGSLLVRSSSQMGSTRGSTMFRKTSSLCSQVLLQKMAATSPSSLTASALIQDWSALSLKHSSIRVLTPGRQVENCSPAETRQEPIALTRTLRMNTELSLFSRHLPRTGMTSPDISWQSSSSMFSSRTSRATMAFSARPGWLPSMKVRIVGRISLWQYTMSGIRNSVKQVTVLTTHDFTQGSGEFRPSGRNVFISGFDRFVRRQSAHPSDIAASSRNAAPTRLLLSLRISSSTLLSSRGYTRFAGRLLDKFSMKIRATCCRVYSWTSFSSSPSDIIQAALWMASLSRSPLSSFCLNYEVSISRSRAVSLSLVLALWFSTNLLHTKARFYWFMWPFLQSSEVNIQSREQAWSAPQEHSSAVCIKKVASCGQLNSSPSTKLEMHYRASSRRLGSRRARIISSTKMGAGCMCPIRFLRSTRVILRSPELWVVNSCSNSGQLLNPTIETTCPMSPAIPAFTPVELSSANLRRSSDFIWLWSSGR